MTCVMPFAFPACLNHTSLLTTVVYISALTQKCYEKNVVPGCVMPVLADHPDDLYPVYNNFTDRQRSNFSSQRVITAKRGQLPQDASHLFINTTLGAYTIITPGVTITGARPGIVVDSLVVAAPDVTIEHLTIKNLTFQTGIDLKALKLENVEVQSSVSIAPTPEQHTVNLNGALFSNITGGAIALFRHTGTATCSGTLTLCFILSKNDAGAPTGIVQADQGATVVNVSAITNIYGDQYLISFFAFNKEEKLIEATRLAGTLFWPTVVAIFSIFLAHGQPKKRVK